MLCLYKFKGEMKIEVVDNIIEILGFNQSSVEENFVLNIYILKKKNEY